MRTWLMKIWQRPDVNGRWNTPHIDNPNEKALAIVYYINDSDGDTCVFDGDSVYRYSPVRGSCLVLPANVSHASSNPVRSRHRMVLNIVITPAESC